MEIRKAVEEHQVDFGFTSSPFSDFDNKVMLTDFMVAVSPNEFKEKTPIDIGKDSEKYMPRRSRNRAGGTAPQKNQA